MSLVLVKYGKSSPLHIRRSVIDKYQLWRLINREADSHCCKSYRGTYRNELKLEHVVSEVVTNSNWSMYMLKYKCWQRLKQASSEIWKQRGRRTSQEPLKSENQRLGNYPNMCSIHKRSRIVFQSHLFSAYWKYTVRFSTVKADDCRNLVHGSFFNIYWWSVIS